MPDKNEQQQATPARSNPIEDLYKKLDAANKYLDSVSDKPDVHRQAAIDALVTDVMPGLQRLMGGLARFVPETATFINDTVAIVREMQAGMSDINERLEALEEVDASILLAEDADKIHSFVAASLGVVSKLPVTDQARQPLIDLGKEVLDIVKDARVEQEEEEEEEGDAGEQQ